MSRLEPVQAGAYLRGELRQVVNEPGHPVDAELDGAFFGNDRNVAAIGGLRCA